MRGGACASRSGIPVGAGLGGGSADAGVALRLANATLPEPLASGDLVALAAEVGSDVPFFASGLGAALARGRGERLEPCALRAPAWVVAAWPGVALSTAEVYARYRPPAAARERVAELAAEPFATADPARLAALIENDLATVAEELCPATAALRARLLASGALAAAVSGSGCAVFGLFVVRGRCACGRGARRGRRAVDGVRPPRGTAAGARIMA